jgi:hypothetical protein
MQPLNVDHSRYSSTRVRKHEHDTVTQCLYQTTAMSLRFFSNPRRDLGDRLGGASIPQRFKHPGAAVQIGENYGRLNAHSQLFLLLFMERV